MSDRHYFFHIVIMVVLYIALGHARSLSLHPVIPGVFFAINMMIPLFSGIVFGSRVGAAVGLFAPLINSLFVVHPASELVAVIPYCLMGWYAGRLSHRFMAPIAATVVVIGGGLRALLFPVTGLVSWGGITSRDFLLYAGKELLVAFIAVIIIVRLYRTCFSFHDDFPRVHAKKQLLFTTNRHVWFTTGFVTFIVGAAFILVMEKIRHEYNERMRGVGIPLQQRKWYGYGLLVVVIIISVLLVWSSVNEIASAVSAARGTHASIADQYRTNLEPYIPAVASDYVTVENIEKVELYLLSFFSKFLANLGLFIFNAVLIIPLLCYLYYHKREKFVHTLYQHIPQKHRGSLQQALRDMGREIHDFFSAKVIESLIVGLICCIGFFIGGLNGWLLLGLVAGFFNVVPYIGPFLSAVPPLLLALLDSPATALYVIITVIVSQLVDNFYLQPFMISNKIKMDALVAIIITLVGAQLLGVLGMVFAIPVFIVYKVVLRETYIHAYTVYKGRK